MSTLLQVGILGTGNHAKENLLPALKGVDGIKLYALQSRSREQSEQIAARFDIPVTRVAEGGSPLLQDPKCDGVIVSATPEVHESLLFEAIKANKPIFVEKPPAANLASLQKIKDAIDQATLPCVVQFGFNFRHSDFYRDLLQSVADKDSFPMYMKIKSYAAKPVAPMWRYEGVFSSSMYAVHIHAIEMLCYTLGTPVEVQYQVSWLAKNKYVTTVLVTFEGGAQGLLELSNASNRFEFDVECIDSRQNVFRCNGFNHLEVFGPDFKIQGFQPKSYLTYDIPFLRGGFDRTGYSRQFEFFRNSIINNAPDTASLESCIQAYKIIERITAHE